MKVVQELPTIGVDIALLENDSDIEMPGSATVKVNGK